MLESNWAQLFAALIGTEKRIALVVTGGGAGALARCFRREGASKNFLEAVIPYSHAALTEYLGSLPTDPSASEAMAQQLASVAVHRAGREAGEAVGIALVAALPTTPRRRGQDRIHVALRTNRSGVLWSVELVKNAHTRDSAETIADEMVFRALAELCESPANDAYFDAAGLSLRRTPFDN